MPIHDSVLCPQRGSLPGTNHLWSGLVACLFVCLSSWDWMPPQGFSPTIELPAWDSWPTVATLGTAPSLPGIGGSRDPLPSAATLGTCVMVLRTAAHCCPSGEPQHFTFTITIMIFKDKKMHLGMSHHSLNYNKQNYAESLGLVAIVSVFCQVTT